MVKYGGREAGIYRARFVALDTGFVIQDRDSGEEVIRWRWVFQEEKDPTTVGEIDTITSAHMAARSNGLKFFTGMLGRPPTKSDDTDDLIGQIFDITYGPNQNGRLTITNVTRVGLDDQPKPPVSVAPASSQTTAELP